VPLVKLTIDGKAIEAAAGTLVIEAARRAGIEIPASAIRRAGAAGGLPDVPVEVERAPSC